MPKLEFSTRESTNRAEGFSSIRESSNTTLLASLTTTPYTFDWKGMTAWNYNIIAEVVDSKGQKAYDTVYVPIDVAPASVALKAGWNIIGYPYVTDAAVATALASIWDNVQVVKDNETFYLTGSTPALNSLSKLSYSKGYLVKVSKDCLLLWKE